MNLHSFASIGAIVLTLVGYAPYIKAIRAGKVRPHFFSWLIWSLTTSIVFLAQLAAEGGVGAWPTGVSGMITLYVTWLAIKLRGDLSTTRADWMFLVAALLSLPLWLFTTEPLAAVVVLTVVDALGFGPTLRKAWRFPHEESMLFYSIFGVRSLLSIVALESRTLTTMLFPAAMAVACVLVCLLLLRRRRAI